MSVLEEFWVRAAAVSAAPASAASGAASRSRIARRSASRCGWPEPEPVDDTCTPPDTADDADSTTVLPVELMRRLGRQGCGHPGGGRVDDLRAGDEVERTCRALAALDLIACVAHRFDRS